MSSRRSTPIVEKCEICDLENKCKYIPVEDSNDLWVHEDCCRDYISGWSYAPCLEMYKLKSYQLSHKCNEFNKQEQEEAKQVRFAPYNGVLVFKEGSKFSKKLYSYNVEMKSLSKENNKKIFKFEHPDPLIQLCYICDFLEQVKE